MEAGVGQCNVTTPTSTLQSRKNVPKMPFAIYEAIYTLVRKLSIIVIIQSP